MAKRIMTAVIGLPIIAIVALVLPPLVMAVAMSALSVIAVHELLENTGFVPQPRLRYYAMVYAFTVPIWVYMGSKADIMLLELLAFLVVAFADGMTHQKEITFEKIVGAFFGAFIIPYMLSAFLRIYDTTGSRYVMLLPFFYAFMSDAGGYFIGRVCGRHKLAPSVSPHKTIEGSAGGVAFSIIGGLIFGALMQFALGMQVRWGVIVAFGVAESVISQFGDLTFSFIKREFGIKDFGHIFVGHGGVLDRFDSVIFAAPLLELLLWWIPIFA
jgi:phosphatidate cytidylyltransferase